MKVYQLVERRHGKVYELLDTAPVLEGLPRAFARAALKRALDDLHHADGSSWEALNYLAHNLPEARVLVVGAVRPAELSEQPIGINVRVMFVTFMK